MVGAVVVVRLLAIAASNAFAIHQLKHQNDPYPPRRDKRRR